MVAAAPAAAVQPLASLGLGALAASPQWDYVCAVLTAAAALTWVKVFDVLASSGVLDQVRACALCECARRQAGFLARLVCVPDRAACARPRVSWLRPQCDGVTPPRTARVPPRCVRAARRS